MLAALVAVGPTAQPMQPEAQPVPTVLNVLTDRRELIERLTGETLHVRSGAHCPVGAETFKEAARDIFSALYLGKDFVEGLAVFSHLLKIYAPLGFPHRNTIQCWNSHQTSPGPVPQSALPPS